MKNKKYIQIILLVIVFTIPTLIAYLLSKSPNWLQNHSTTNYGVWVPKTIPCPLENEKRPWQLVLWQAQGCHNACMQQLGELAKVRLAMGRKVFDLNIWVVVPKRFQLEDEQVQFLENHDIRVGYFDEGIEKQWNEIIANAPIVLVNPEKEALLMYPLNPQPKRLFHDLQLLIK